MTPSTPLGSSSLARGLISLFPPPLSHSSSLSSEETYHHSNPFNDSYHELRSLATTVLICCGILITYRLIRHIVLGSLRVSEAQLLRDALWDYFLQKSVFILFMLDLDPYKHKSSWTIWSTIMGSIALLSLACKIAILMAILFLSSILANALLVLAPSLTPLAASSKALPSTGEYISSQSSFTHQLFLLADSTYILMFVSLALAKCLIISYDLKTNSNWETKSEITYFSDFILSLLIAIIDLLHHAHLLVNSYTCFLSKGYCFIRINVLVLAIRRRWIKHRNYINIVNLMNTNFPMASEEDISGNKDDCAICWDNMEKGRKLPCGHLFHNSCLLPWMEQETSCPTCRKPLSDLKTGESYSDESDESWESDEEFSDASVATNNPSIMPRIQFGSNLFQYDGSRYNDHLLFNWLRTINIEGFP